MEPASAYHHGLKISVPVDSVKMLVVRPKIVFVDGAAHTELIIDVFKLFDAVTDLRVSFQFLVDDFLVLDPGVRLLVVDIVRSVFLKRRERGASRRNVRNSGSG